MAFFTPRSKNGTAPAVEKRKRSRRQMEPYSMATRPTFGQWLKVTWLDLLTMVVLGAVGLGVSDPAFAPRTFD